MSARPCALVDGAPHYSMELPAGAVFVGMEAEPNQKPRYGTLHHPWFNLPCYETARRHPNGGEYAVAVFIHPQGSL